MQIYWSLLVCLVGLVLYLILDNPPASPNPSTLNRKMSVVGLHMFWVGLFVFLLMFAGSSMATLLPHH
jgi:hypothetical protein